MFNLIGFPPVAVFAVIAHLRTSEKTVEWVHILIKITDINDISTILYERKIPFPTAKLRSVWPQTQCGTFWLQQHKTKRGNLPHTISLIYAFFPLAVPATVSPPEKLLPTSASQPKPAEQTLQWKKNHATSNRTSSQETHVKNYFMFSFSPIMFFYNM